MTQLKLTYFDMHGGRSEPARLAMHIGGIAFEDRRFAFPEFVEVRKTTPFGQVPTLHVDGVQVTQSDAITRYVGKLTGLYPLDAYQALLCDEVLDVLEDANVKLGTTFGLTSAALKEARTARAIAHGSELAASPAGSPWRCVFCRQPPHHCRPEGLCVCARAYLRQTGPCAYQSGGEGGTQGQRAHAAHGPDTRGGAVLRQI